MDDARHRAAKVLGAVAIGATLIVACGDDTEPTGGGPRTSGIDGTTTSTEAETVDDDTPPRTGQSEAAVADLAERLDVDPAEVSVVSVEAVTWSDGSLGCPEPGMMYPQVLTEGVRIVLEVDGQQYRYHGGAAGDPSFCARPQEPHSIG